MAWTTPRTWSGGELVTDTIMNAHIRDNLNVLRGQIRYAVIEVFAPGVTVTTGDGKKDLPLLTDFNGMNVVEVYAQVRTAGTTGTTTIQINNSRAGDVLSTRITIDSGETGSNTAAVPAVINTATDDIATYDNLRIDVDGVQTTAPLGLIVVIGFQYP